tara:strand:+ start:6064 stop:6327 length:264 start_codon:yes stop_codon:yes gene_type:complete
MGTTLYKPFKYTGRGIYKFSVNVKEDGRTKLIHFGNKNYKDFTQHGDEKKRKAYLARAKGIQNKKGQLTYKDKNTKNYWSVHYLWNG